MFKHLENEQEKAARLFAKEFCKMMGWPKIKIARFKIGRMLQYRGYALVAVRGTREMRFIFASTAEKVYADNMPTEKEFWHVIAHELVHLYIWHITGSVEKAFGHGKTFIKVCESIQKKSRGYFTVKGLMQ